MTTHQPVSTDTTFPYDLTIAMIFRNDIKYIRQCLETMKPLRDLLRLQLVMTDTGSTDGSRAVAEEYADVLLDFTWCDDFSAARNTGVAKAQGRWFAYFDCDTEFDHTISHLADFVKHPENHKKYQSAHIILMDYIKSGNTILTEKKERPYLVNFSYGKKEFIHPIHETIPLPPTHATIPMNLFHWGYFDNPHLKRARNIPILEKSIQRHPKDLKNYLQLVSEVETDRQRIALLEQGLQASVDDQNQQLLRQVATVALLGCALREGEETLFQETKTLLQSAKLPLGIQQEFYGHLTTHALEHAKCDDAYILFQLFQSIYKENEKNPDGNTFSQGFFAYKHPNNFYDLERKLLTTFLQHQRKAEAIAILRRSQSYLFQLEEHNPFFAAAFQSAFALRDFTTLRGYYLYLLQEKKVSLLHHSQHYLEEETSKLQREEKEDFQNLFTLDIQDTYTALWKLRQKDFQLEDCPPTVGEFLSKSHLLHPITNYSDLLQHYFQKGEDSFGFLSRTPMAQLLISTTHLLKKYPQYHETIREGIQQFQKEPDRFSALSLKEQGFWANIGFLTLQKETQQEENSNVLPLFASVSKTMYLYLEQVYLPPLLQYHPSTLLSPEESLSCIARKAHSEPDDVLSYIKSLKEVSQISPPYQRLIHLLIQVAKKRFQQTAKVPTRPIILRPVGASSGKTVKKPVPATKSVAPEIAVSSVPSVPSTKLVTPEIAVSSVQSVPSTKSVTPEIAVSSVPSVPSTKSVTPEIAVSSAQSVPSTKSVTPEIAVSSAPSVPSTKSVAPEIAVSSVPSVPSTKLVAPEIAVSSAQSVPSTKSVTPEIAVSSAQSVPSTKSVAPEIAVSSAQSVPSTKSVTPEIAVSSAQSVPSTKSVAPEIAVSSAQSVPSTKSVTPEIAVSSAQSVPSTKSVAPEIAVSSVPSVPSTKSVTPEIAVSAQQSVPSAKLVSPEVLALGLKIKKAIALLLSQGKGEQAKIALDKYKILHPTDPEIPQLEQRCKS